MIKIENVGVSKENKTILAAISVTLTEPRIGIIGSNGSGKSTFAKLLNGLERATTGAVFVNDAPIGKNNKTALGKVGFVFQNPDNQIVFPIVVEDLAFGLKKSGLSKQQIQSRITTYLEQFGLRHLLERRTHELSGGEKQLIALIGVLLMEPEIIVLDEPTTLLDLRNRSILLKLLAELPQKLIIVSHDLALMAEMDRLLWIENGNIHQDGSPEAVISAYRQFAESES
jgi:biotin transport system ATP-binding protein